MTVSVEDNKITLAADGIEVAFTFSFKYQNNTDILVYLPDEGEAVTEADLQTEGIDYTLAPSVTGPDNGGTVTFGVAPADTKEVFIIRELPLDQEKQFKPNTNFPERVIEGAYDKLTLIGQQLQEQISRSLLLPANTEIEDLTIPAPDAGKALKWNATEDGLENTDVDIDDAIDEAAASAAAAAVSESNAAASEAAAAASEAAAASSANDAADSAQDAEDAAASLNFPIIQAGDALKYVQITPAEDGYQYSEIEQGLPTGYVSGLLPENDGTDSEHDIVFNTGSVRSKDDTEDIVFSSALIKQIDANWAAGDNAGGFPSGLTLAVDTWYHLFVIKNPSTGVVDAGFDTSLTASNLLADATGFTLYRRIGSVLTDGSSNILPFTASELSGGGMQSNWHFSSDTLGIADLNTSASATKTNLTLTVPTGIKVKPLIITQTTGSSSVGFNIYDLNNNAQYRAGALSANSQSELTTFSGLFYTDISSQIAYSITGTTVNTTVETYGYIDERIA